MMGERFRTFEMSISGDEFRRLLPGALAGSDFEEAGNTFAHTEGGRHWRITLQPLPALGLGAIRLERYRVEWSFAGYSGAEIAALVDRFELQFRRGGG